MASQRGPRETAFFNIGVQGRKTGVTVADTGKRDEFGMEDMDDFFSPVKTGLTPAPPPKPVPSQLSQFTNANQTQNQSLTEGTMDVEQSSGIDPTTMIANHKAQKARQLSAPPTDSLAFLKPTSSPTRGSSVGPTSTPARRLDFSRPDLAGARSSSVLGSPLRNSSTNGVTKTNGHGKELSNTPLAAPSSATNSSKRSSSASQQLPPPIVENATEEQTSSSPVLKKKPAPRKGLMSMKQKVLPSDDETDTTDEIDTVVNRILDEMEGDDVEMVDAEEPPRSQQRKGKENGVAAKKPTPVKQAEKKVVKKAAPVPEPEEEEEEEVGEEEDLEPVAIKKEAPVKKSPVGKKLVSQKAKKAPEPEPEVIEEEEMEEDIPEPVKKPTKRKAPELAPQPVKKAAAKKKAPEPEPELETEPESEEELEIEDEEDLEPVAKKGKKVAAKQPTPKKPTPKKPTPKQAVPKKAEPVKKAKGKKVAEPEPAPEEEEFEDAAEEFEEEEEEEAIEEPVPAPKRGKKAAAAKVPTPKKAAPKKPEPVKKAAKGNKAVPIPIEEEEPEPEPLPSQTSKGRGKGKAAAKPKAALKPLPAKRSGRSSKAAVTEPVEDIEMEDAPSVPTPIKKPSKAAAAAKVVPKGRGKKAAEPIPEPEEEEPPKKKSRSSTGAAKATPPAKATKTAKGKKPAAAPAEVIAEEEAESSSQAATKGRKKAPAKKTLPASELPASPAAPTAPRPSQRIIIEAPPVTPAVADDGTRRSRRHRIAPLQYWKGEKIDYVLEAAQDKNGKVIRMPKIAALVRVEEATPVAKPKGTRKPAASVEPVERVGKRKRGRKAREEDEEEQDHDSDLGELDAWEMGETGSDDEDAGIKVGLTKVFPPQFDEDEEPIMEPTKLAYTKDRMQTADIANGAFRFVKTVTQDTFGTGIMEVPPGGGKRTKSSGKMTLVFYMLAGRATVTVAGERFRVRKGGQFMIPRGNLYSIENEFDVEARMFFAQGRDLTTEEQVDAGQE
ncbi:hypothetical protein FPQ18DRAFT_400386 [Pyronema domesticum]|uniref:CENP-C homolog n=1 Tax=Pyronema omphalodes (strain CBS 100304) TaxID=1076935 RepID=U4KWY8_PYROM|nr:hypothetical protein FPQ18DRAFT_400386 [Pyronema domesticum]CCX06482.1 Similar to Centromere protein 3; acc. no. Q9USR9 [Pyronema omphalodes CBS 100304]